MRIVKPSTGGVANETDPVVKAIVGVVKSDGATIAACENLDDVAYLPAAGKAADSDKLDNRDSTDFADADHNHDATYLGLHAKADTAGTADSATTAVSADGIRYDANPTVDANGEAAIDSTAKQLLIYDGAASVYATATRSVTFVLDTPQAADVFEIMCLDRDITITKVTAYTIGAGTTYTFNIEERTSTTPGTAGTDVMTADLTADADGASTQTLSNAGIAAENHLTMVGTSISGAPTKLIIRIDYTEDRK